MSAAARLLDSVAARIRLLLNEDMTFVGWLVVVFVGLGSGMITVQLWLTGNRMPAAGTVLLGAGLALTGFKVHRSAVGSAKLLREHRRHEARVRAFLAELRRDVGTSHLESGNQRRAVDPFAPQQVAAQDEFSVQPARKASAPEAPAAPGQTEGGNPQQASALRGTGSPFAAVEASSVKVVDRGSRGRQAAAVTEDEARPWKLFSATLGMGSSLPETTGRTLRPIAGVVSPTLLGLLQARFALTQLHPGLLQVELDYAQPTAVVFEEAALDSGVWFGALRTTGTALFAEIRVALMWAKARRQSIFVLPDNTPKPYSATLRRQATYLVHADPLLTDMEDGVSSPLLESLRDHVRSANLAATRSLSEVRRAG